MNFDTDRPIYLQVIEEISKQLIRGQIHLGDKLPSVRELAVAYRINPNTASRVYKDMEAKGLCFTKRGMGTFITEDEEILNMIRGEMAESYLDTFSQGMQDLGYSLEDMILLLEEHYTEESD